ncbi:MAG: hypothetical protein KAS32_24520 [Candidatus Peribacteraceae bacterium]|nr:hypothetical protein [Candidatus Peribacteraceae bacterium]
MNLGCVIGTKTEKTVVFVSHLPIPETANGVAIIATNKKIPITILNKEGFLCEVDLGGKVVLSPTLYDFLIRKYNENKGK